MYKKLNLTLLTAVVSYLLLSLGFVNTTYADANVSHSNTASNSQMSPVGYWQAFEDGKPRSIIQIEEKNGTLMGYVRKVFYRPGEGPTDVCTVCSGDRHNQLFLGMNMIWGMTPQNGKWGGGYILDPETGKIYHGIVKVQNNGEKLYVRGYIGFSLIGRTDTWVRVNSIPTDV